MLTLHHAPTSVCSQKVRVGLACMGLGYESRLLDLQKGDQFAPDYVALNPDAVVPTLVDDGLVVRESSVILAYLDREHNGGRLMPMGRAERAQAEHWLLRCLGLHSAINTLTFSTAMRKAILARKSPDEVRADAARMPDPIMAQKRVDLLLNGLASPHVGQATLHIRRTLDDLEAGLSADWMGGAVPGIVDVALVAYLDRLDRLGLDYLFAAHPRIALWLARWQAHAAYAEGIAKWVPEGSEAAMRAAGREHRAEIETAWAASAR